MKVLTESVERLIKCFREKKGILPLRSVCISEKNRFFLKMFFLSGKNGFIMYVYLCSLSACLKKCICLIISLFSLRQKVCKISLQHTKDVKLLPGTYLANSFEVRNVPFNDIQTKYQSL